MEVRQRWPNGVDDRGADISFKQVLDLGVTFERATKEVETVKDSSINKMNGLCFGKFASSNRCWNCGYEKHLKSKCPARDVKCRICGEVGHFARVCKQKNKNFKKTTATRKLEKEDVDSSGDEDIDELKSVRTVKGITPRACIKVLINGKHCEMEFDSGARVSTIDKKWWVKLGRPKLYETNQKVSGYGKNKLKVMGALSVDITLGAVTKKLPALVMDVVDVPLFGIPWILAFNLKMPAEVVVNKIKEGEGNLKQDRDVGGKTRIECLKSKYSAIFKDELGRAKGMKAKIFLKNNAEPIAFSARRVPFPLRAGVKCELDRLEKMGIIEKVDPGTTPIEWATPTVNVNKGNGQVRICGDFKVTLNPNLVEDKYTLPTFEDLTSKLVGGKRFTVIDLRDAYLQVEVDEVSKNYLNIVTQWGYYTYKRLPFGLSSAPGIFQRYMEQVLQGIPHVGILLDDVIITGPNEDTHYNICEEVLRRLHIHGLRIKLSKCRFYEKEVNYLGHVIDSDGIHPTEEKVEAIKRAPAPKNVTQLRAFLGMVNFHSRFIPNLQARCTGLHKLTKKGVSWKWTEEEEQNFELVKTLLSDKDSVVPYDINREVRLVCDASEYGLGAMLVHIMDNGTERPVAHASRVLSKAEQRYAPVDKEALALVFGVTRFHQYLYGRKFILESDHKPLERIFGTKRDLSKMTNSRLVRWAIHLSSYDYTIQHRPGNSNCCADALSRLPLEGNIGSCRAKTTLGENIRVLYCKKTLQEETKGDNDFKKIMAFIEKGWPKTKLEGEASKMEIKKEELAVEDGILTWLGRIVVPKSLRRSTLEELHAGHPGITAMKGLARYYVWWPGMDKEVEQYVKGCSDCQEHRDNIAEVPLYPWNVPSRPWERVHLDFAGPFEGFQWLVLVDAYSKWVEVAQMRSITAIATIQRLREWFGRFGVPAKLVTDNGPQLTSEEFRKFCEDNNIQHIRTAPYHPRTNGLAERFIKTLKQKLSTAKRENKDWFLTLNSFLLSYRNTPHFTTGLPPAEMMLGRRLPTLFDNIRPNLRDTITDRIWKQKEYFDKGKEEREFRVGEEVWVKKELSKGWTGGVVTERTGGLSYKVAVDGVEKRKHADQLRSRQGNLQDDQR